MFEYWIGPSSKNIVLRTRFLTFMWSILKSIFNLLHYYQDQNAWKLTKVLITNRSRIDGRVKWKMPNQLCANMFNVCTQEDTFVHIGRVDKLFNQLMGGCFDQPGIINQCLHKCFCALIFEIKGGTPPKNITCQNIMWCDHLINFRLFLFNPFNLINW